MLTTFLLTLALSGAAAGSATTGSFADWVASLREEARGRNISEETLDAALAGVEPIPRVIELDRNQPEFKLTLQEYVSRFVSNKSVEWGRRALAENRSVLGEIASRYGVQPRFVVALWGIESRYGRHTGGFRVIDALATLAFDGRRAKFFRGELLDALTILDEGHTSAEKMTGSWAGAMGQPQFMPSSFRRHGVDFDGDGRRDIWGTTADVLASAANYLSSVGWHADQTWGRQVRLPAPFDAALIGRKVRKTLPEWQALGVRRADGSDLPSRPLEASLVRPDTEGAAYLIYDNFRSLMDWNRSEYFGIAVGTLSDRIAR